MSEYTEYQETMTMNPISRGVSMESARAALEQVAECEVNPLSRFRARRVARNDRAFARFYSRIADRLDREVVVYAGATGFDFQAILDWFIENWDELLKILLTIIPLFI